MCKNWTTCLCIALGVIVLFDSSRAHSTESTEDKQITCTGKVLDERGRPIAGVKVSLREMIFDEATYLYNPKVLGEVHTGTDGAFSFKETIKNDQYRYGYIIGEKENLALGFDNWSMRDGDKELEIKLGPSKELSGIVVDEKGMPVPEAKVIVSMLVLGEGSERKHLTGLALPEKLATSTNDKGQFTFNRIPAGATAEFFVSKPGKATLSTYKRTGEPYQKLHFTEGQKDIKLPLSVEANIEGITVNKNSGKPIGGIQLRYTNGQEPGYFRTKSVTSKTDGTFRIGALSETQYVLEPVAPSDQLPEWVADRVEVFAETGKTKSGIKIKLSKGGILEVKISDAVNKEPVEQAHLSVRNQVNSRYQSSRSDKNGMAYMRLMPGEYQIYYVYKQGYSRQRPEDIVTIEKGKTERLEYALHSIPTISGIVHDDTGKPIEGVELEICPMGGRPDSVSDKKGEFEVKYDPGRWHSRRPPDMFLIGRHQTRNLAGSIRVDEDTRETDIKLEPAVTLFGRIVDPNGKGIAGIEVRTMLHESSWGSTVGSKPATTDNDGKYEIHAMPPGRTYNVYARAEGYGESRSEEINAETAVNCRLDMGDLILAVANLSVSGIVIDDDGNPVAGARVNAYGDGQPHRSILTDKEGKFTIEKVCAGKMRISARKTVTTRLYGNIETEGGATDIRIVISQRSSSRRYEPRRPPSLIGRPLPKLDDLNVHLTLSKIAGKKLLVCFWDMQQRPSRHCLMQLAQQADQLKDNDVIIIAVQSSKMDHTSLAQWVKKYKIPFPVGMVQRSFEKARFIWGIRSLPWLILTDTEHVIRSTGFPIHQLNEKLKQLDGQ